MKLPEQVTRLGGVILLAVAVVALLRFVVLPSTMFSARPHQEAKALREMAKPVRFAGMTTCRSCHEEEYDTKLKAQHRTIGCENCHGPAAAHVANKDDKSLVPPKHREREFCLGCHGYVSSRPNGFPQVDGTKHKAGKRCVSCHDAHDPTPPETPTDCAGCHGRIARIKAVSTHADLECSACHQAPPQHMTAPRSALPTKPLGRDACASCHDSASATPATETVAPKAAAKAAAMAAPTATARRVDFKTHGRTFVCWECHYAHLPEGPK